VPRLIVNREPPTGVDVSLVLLDWSCRESPHFLDCLAEQNVDRERYEIIWIEYYQREWPALRERMDRAAVSGRTPPVDVWAVLGMDLGLCYHKHAMYNAGILLARGRVVCFADSDALVRPTFIESIINAFRADPNIVLHLDEVRNNDPSFYPFGKARFEDITGFGCINWVNGRPLGLLDKADPLHTRNYGACMAARRDDLIAIGGADMHLDYLGHIAGAYEMTWRLVNLGKREVWHDAEWLYHVWHPGQAGDRNYAGPHDGRHISTRALMCLHSDRTLPFLESPGLRKLRPDAGRAPNAALLEEVMDPDWLPSWRYDRLGAVTRSYRLGERRIRLRECPGANPPAAAHVPPLGHRLGWWTRLCLRPVALRILWHQWWVKWRAAALAAPRLGRSPAQEGVRKSKALVSFVKRIIAFDRFWFRQCSLALGYAIQERRTDLILYGEGDVARVLCAMARRLPVNIKAVCPFRPTAAPRLLGRPTITEKEMAQSGDTIVLAAIVGIGERVERLKALGVPRGRIITLQ
jgi:GT2 family glycosyltransferase